MSGTKDTLEALIDADELYHSAPCGYCSLSLKGEILKVNRTLLTWLKSDEKLVGNKFTMLLPKGGQMHFEMFFLPMVSMEGRVKELSYELICNDGSSIPILLAANTIIGENGKIKAINVAITDSSERRLYEKELLKAKNFAEREQKRLEFMADLAHEMIWTANSTGRINYFNARFCEYFNCGKQETRTSFFLAKVHPEELRGLLGGWRKSQSSGGEFNQLIRLRNQDSNYEWHQLKASRFVFGDDDQTSWFGSCLNVNEHIGALKKKDEFINIASHELRTPITSLKAILQLLQRMKTEGSERMAGLIDKANHNVGRVTEMIDDLLNASQLNEGQLKLNKKSFNLSEMIGSCVHHIRIEDNYKITTIGDATVSVLADEGRIEQVLSNFITNAIKYAPESYHIKIRITPRSGFVQVAVTDEGPGIPAEKLPYLFDRYYQVNTSGGRYSGLGLGLFICAEIVRQHGGDIGAESVVGKGSTFWFTLPV
ncbi:PAS domain-containing sensor histidine kinase [Pedobacter sp. Leaf194]|uniref:PAS domain-containing sensor histidine kinase n=1 Tax=Pedobacter sp. Leaf194 TaxID=1736297 RepID=UPI0007034A7F|nr:PAS domain-containing sensor histidine kinase [Pedobacter sp. Leaf194]KQS35787.1 hypothetical protein ASG14_09990 [Pedobacter sp. Leaf194]